MQGSNKVRPKSYLKPFPQFECNSEQSYHKSYQIISNDALFQLLRMGFTHSKSSSYSSRFLILGLEKKRYQIKTRSTRDQMTLCICTYNKNVCIPVCVFVYAYKYIFMYTTYKNTRTHTHSTKHDQPTDTNCRSAS